MSKKKKIIIPSILKVDKDTLSDSYGKFIAEPFESGYGNTLGNSLRRILLSSLEGNAITSVKINGLPHEYSVIDGVKEDVMSILLNLKLVRFSSNVETYEEQVLRLHKEQEGPVFARAPAQTASDGAARQQKDGHRPCRRKRPCRGGRQRRPAGVVSRPGGRHRRRAAPVRRGLAVRQAAGHVLPHGGGPAGL